MSIGAGGYLPKGNLDLFMNGMEDLNKWEKAEIKKARQEGAEILHALYNYECFYQCSPQDAIDRLPQYSPEKIWKVYRENFKKAMADI